MSLLHKCALTNYVVVLPGYTRRFSEAGSILKALNKNLKMIRANINKSIAATFKRWSAFVGSNLVYDGFPE